MKDSQILIREFIPQDRNDVRRIACETSFLEQDRRLFLDDDAILADILTLYFTDYEPGSCFVAVKDGRVIGYIIGARDIGVMNKIFLTKVLPPVIFKSVRTGALLRPVNLKLLGHMAVSSLKGEFFLPDFSKEYPATLHINIDRDFRGRHLGRALAERYFDFLRENGIKGIHVYTMSDKAARFFSNIGFRTLFRTPRSHLRYRLAEIVNFYVLGRRLDACV